MNNDALKTLVAQECQLLYDNRLNSARYWLGLALALTIKIRKALEFKQPGFPQRWSYGRSTVRRRTSTARCSCDGSAGSCLSLTYMITG
jgi:hypothetical protein